MSIDVQKIRADFPILQRQIRGKPLVYFDNAATSQKPRQVIQSLTDFYEKHNANVHRGIHTLSAEATEMMEGARKKVADFFDSLFGGKDDSASAPPAGAQRLATSEEDSLLGKM
jgi:cysteine desulfurase/selenocysteine lyase